MSRLLTATLDALARLSLDETETPARRKRAAEAVAAHIGALPNIDGSGVADGRGRRNLGHSGGDSLRGDAIYDGWGD